MSISSTITILGVAANKELNIEYFSSYLLVAYKQSTSKTLITETQLEIPWQFLSYLKMCSHKCLHHVYRHVPILLENTFTYNLKTRQSVKVFTMLEDMLTLQGVPKEMLPKLFE